MNFGPPLSAVFTHRMISDRLDRGLRVVLNTTCSVSRNPEKYLSPESIQILQIVQTASAPTANEEMNVSEIKVISNDGQVIVTNASGKMITLSNILGQTIGVRRANSEYFSMPATSGIVLVTVEGDATYKVIVK